MKKLFVIASLVLGLSGASYAKPVKTGYAPVNGLQMYYEIWGPAGGTTLVLLHGGDPTIGTSFRNVIEPLAKHRLVIAFEQQGHGRTADIPDRPFSFEQTAEDTVALLRYLKIGKADFMGYSNGGHIALEIALKHPEMVRKLIIESAMFERSGSDPAFWDSFKNPKLETMPKELREAYLKTAPHPEQLESYFDKSVRRMREFKGWTRKQIRSINAPTLVLIGDSDIVRPEHAVEMFRLLPHGQLAILPMTDHMAMANRGDWVSSMVEAFLNAPPI
jgi:pimeloyl-ACP methyl ester carboxylesterase